MAEKKDNKGTIIIVLCTAIGSLVTIIGILVFIWCHWDNLYEGCKTKRDKYEQERDSCKTSLATIEVKINTAKAILEATTKKWEDAIDTIKVRDRQIGELKDKKIDILADFDKQELSLIERGKKIKELEDRINILEKEKIEYEREIERLKKEWVGAMAKRIVAEKKSRTYSAINITDITQNSIKYDIVFDDDDFDKIKKRNYSKMEILTGLENLTTNKIIEPVEKKEGIYRRDSFSTIQAKYELGFVIPRGILKNYKKTIYERKTKGRDAFKITVYLENNGKEKIAVRLFYLQRK